jgi:hypothetical protein
LDKTYQLARNVLAACVDHHGKLHLIAGTHLSSTTSATLQWPRMALVIARGAQLTKRCEPAAHCDDFHGKLSSHNGQVMRY